MRQSRAHEGYRMGTVDRREFLQGSMAAAGGLAVSGLLPSVRAGGGGAPALLIQDRARPASSWGVAVGDVTADRATVWSRADRPAQMIVEYATGESFEDAFRVVGTAVLVDSDFTARAELVGLPAGRRLFYRVSFEDVAAPGTLSLPVEGSFRTAPADARDVTFAWSADTAGQGWGINPEWGGFRMFETMRRAGPDFFIHCGDVVYADGPLKAEVRLDDGAVWRNVVTPAKAKVAETLEEFRGNYLYNLMDENYRRFAAEVPQVVIWDDHETLDNWYPGEVLRSDGRHAERHVDVLTARARRAFLEYMPVRLDPAEPGRLFRSLSYGPLLEVFVPDMRSYRGPNSTNRQERAGRDTAFLGERQLRWLRERLLASRAAWKVIAASMPIGLIVPDAGGAFENIANGDGPPLGRELEMAELLRFIHVRRIRNVVWLTGDVHYAAAHHYDPARARFRDFSPFWEFVAGPLHAGTFGPNALDPTFGPEVRFLAIPPAMKPNRPPTEGLQFFGLIRIAGASRVMTVSLHDLEGRRLYNVELQPEV